jgi:hypothetical protein
LEAIKLEGLEAGRLESSAGFDFFIKLPEQFPQRIIALF